ncbi:unnamed protein product [Ilex paraguariensis]|uniref:Uncharacterized protein n=1 Tax=Ilex paraguariensis TaxID=185542 RepID=A0ABC8TI48_9AQUA
MNVVHFFVGLKPEYKSIRAQIWDSFSLLSLLEVFSRLQRATLSVGHSTSSIDHDSFVDRSALVASIGNSSSIRGGRINRGGRGACTRGRTNISLCIHCGRISHTVDYCWDLHRKPWCF